MARKSGALKLVPFNSKIDGGTKQLIDALVVTKAAGASSVRELLEDMLAVYEVSYPAAFVKARGLIEFQNSDDVQGEMNECAKL